VGIPGKAAIERLDTLEDAGVDPRRVCIGHLGNLNDPNLYVHKTICRRGGFVGFDRQGGNGDANVVPLVAARCGFRGSRADLRRRFARLRAPSPRTYRSSKPRAPTTRRCSESSATTRGGLLAFVPKRARRV
jgi:hypothetical protein